MSSTSGSDYRLLCAAFIEEALLRPRMYFHDLTALESFLQGHATAFSQLGHLGAREETFNASFAAWLRAKTGVSAAAGWAHAITELAAAADLTADTLFIDHVRAFLKEWPSKPN